jgi:hypothetical protein
MSTTKAPELPSIIDLALHAGSVGTTSRRLYDTASERPRRGDKGLALGCDQEHQIHKLITTMRAKTLADVAAQLFAGYIIIDQLDGDDDLSEYRSDILQLRRVILGGLSVVAQAAGVELAALGADYLPRYIDDEFPPLSEEALP